MSSLSESTQNIRLLLEYKGSAYVGWQYQPGHPSIEGELRKAIKKISGEDVELVVAGRTDAGVHAQGQVANFFTQRMEMEPRRWAPALNGLMPRDISVHRAEGAPQEFSARHDSISKRYVYKVYLGKQPAALVGELAWYRPYALNLEQMHKGAQLLIGDHDFNAFRSRHCDAAHARRSMFNITISQTERLPQGKLVEITFHANAFCRHMCRILAGTLVELGMGKRSVESIGHALASGERDHAGMTAPPHGLTLLHVEYPSQISTTT